MRHALRALIHPFREFIFPPACFSCDTPLRRHEGKICASCLSAIASVSGGDDAHQQTLARLRKMGHVSDLIASFYFGSEGPLQTLIHQLKYSGMTVLGVELGRTLGRRIVEVVDPGEVAALIPVPLHPVKERERGYNQSDFICRGVTGVISLPSLPHLLSRIRYTRSQTALSIEERRHNVHGAFSIDAASSHRLIDQTFLLVDDVITTGATMDACARTLLDHGARRVIACSVALAP
jgi:ComF family protein